MHKIWLENAQTEIANAEIDNEKVRTNKKINELSRKLRMMHTGDSPEKLKKKIEKERVRRRPLCLPAPEINLRLHSPSRITSHRNPHLSFLLYIPDVIFSTLLPSKFHNSREEWVFAEQAGRPGAQEVVCTRADDHIQKRPDVCQQPPQGIPSWRKRKLVQRGTLWHFGAMGATLQSTTM